MNRRRRHASLALLLLGLLALGVRGGGLHWHLCFDGLERPQSLHWSEPGPATEYLEHANASLHDTDVCIVADALTHTTPDSLIHVPAVWLLIYIRSIDFQLPKLAVNSDPIIRIGKLAHLIPQPRGPPR
jgi:hypothetical protein